MNANERAAQRRYLRRAINALRILATLAVIYLMAFAAWSFWT